MLQFTDLHLFAEPGHELFGLATRHTFEAVVERARARHWPPDAILFTGDLVHDERREGYRYLRRFADSLGVPYFCIPGNHDHTPLLAAEIDAGANEPFRVERVGPWDLVLLDSTVEGSDGGRLPPDALTGLHHHLSINDGRPTMVCLHHHPVAVGSRWMDTMRVENGAALLALVEQHSQLRSILWGHVHQPFDRHHGQARLLATPSTCVQFAPGHRDFAVNEQPPGYRWLELHADGRINTGIELVQMACTERGSQAVENPLIA